MGPGPLASHLALLIGDMTRHWGGERQRPIPRPGIVRRTRAGCLLPLF